MIALPRTHLSLLLTLFGGFQLPSAYMHSTYGKGLQVGLVYPCIGKRDPLATPFRTPRWSQSSDNLRLNHLNAFNSPVAA